MRIHPEIWALGGVIIIGLVWGGIAWARHAQNPDQPIDNSQTTPANNNAAGSSGLIQKCPSAWYENHMPQVGSPGQAMGVAEGYLIIDGKNYAEEQVDLQWVRMNCEVNQPSAVY